MPSISPKVCSVMPKRWISGCTPDRLARRLEVSHRVHGRAVDPRLEVEVVAEAVTRAADVADHLALLDAGAHRGAVARLVRVARREGAAVLHARVVPVTSRPAQQHHPA